jgi:hypothetical protein
MKFKFTLLLFILLLTAPCVFAQKQTVYVCANKPPATDSLLQNAIGKSIANNSSIEFLTEDSPCDHTKYIVNALNRTINKKSFNLAANHSFSSVKNGENPFSVERFIFKNNQTAAAIARALKNRSVNTLQIKEFTLYDFVLVENNLILFIADRESYEANQPLFDEIKNNLQAEYKTHRK